MSHTGFHTQRKLQRPRFISNTMALGSPNSVSFATRRASASPFTVMICAMGLMGPKTCSIFRAMISS